MRVVVLSFYHGLGHVVRSARIASELAAAGAEVVFASAAAGLRWAESAGVPTVALTELPPLPPATGDPAPAAPSPNRLRMADPEYLRTSLAQERALIRELGADFVLADFRVTGPVSARLEGVRSGTIVNTGFFSYPFPDVVAQVMPELGKLGVPEEIIGKPLGDVAYVPDWSTFDPLSSVRNPHSLQALGTVDEIRYVGPVLKQNPLAVPDRAQARKILGLDADRPVVYISLGGTAQGYAALRTVAPLLDTIPAYTAVVTGPNIDPALLADHRADRLMQATDESMLWTSAADLVVTHGGHTSVMEALALGRPLLALPAHDEQRWNAGRAVSLGTGEILEADAVAAQFLPAVRRLLADGGLRDRAAEVGGVLAANDGARELAAHVLLGAQLTALSGTRR